MIMRRMLPVLGLVAVALVSASLLTQASSHREAPFITEMPKVDGTDFYMFRSYEPGREGFVTLIANYIPLQVPYGGPNFFFLDPDALYEIHLENNGDAQEDLTFQFRFQNTLHDLALTIGSGNDSKRVSVPLINIGPLGPGAGDPANLNIAETYSHAHAPAYAHSHTHDHGHHHDHHHEVTQHHTHHDDHEVSRHHHPMPGETVSFRELLTLGITGGMVPCPAALVVLLSAVAMQRIGFGLLLIVAFSVGLAAVLMAIGLLMVYARQFMARFQGEGLLLRRWLPLTSAAVVTVFGIAMTLQALVTSGVLHIRL